MPSKKMTARRFPTRELLLCAMFAALTAAGAFLRIPLPLAPITLQFFFCAMAGLMLGAKWGALSQALYVLIGLCGVPVFTFGGGFGAVLSPTFGFLIGLVPAAFFIGLLSRGGTVSFWRVIAACTAGLAVLYLVGVPYLVLIQNAYLGKGLSFWSLLRGGMLIFLPGDALKILLCAVLAPILHRRVKL